MPWSASRFVHGIVHETRRDGVRHGRRRDLAQTRGTRWPRSVRPPETVRDGRDARRMAHNPEVAGSNPAPATKVRGRFSNREPASGMWSVNGFVHHGSERATLRRPCDRLRRTWTQRPLAKGRRLSTKTEETSHPGVASLHCSHVKGPFRSWKGPCCYRICCQRGRVPVAQAQVRADAGRTIVRYQEPPARFSAARTRKKAAHP
jgi:hypothetical protein